MIAVRNCFIAKPGQASIEFEERMRDYRSNNAFREKMAGYTDMYVSGYREILDIVA